MSELKRLADEVAANERHVERLVAKLDEKQDEIMRLRTGIREMWNATSKTEAELITENERLRKALGRALRQHEHDTGAEFPGSWQNEARRALEGSSDE